jgi:glyoxylase-like metal-dependent hydrolase (beta-lactamase superfamily II)
MVLAVPCAAQTNFDTVQVRTIPITTNVYMLQGAGGNIGVSVGSDAVFVIDDQFAPLTKKILAAIAELTPNPVRFVVNTHWHSDHTGGNENLGQAGAIIYAHENVRRRMTAGTVHRRTELARRAVAPRRAPRGHVQGRRHVSHQRRFGDNGARGTGAYRRRRDHSLHEGERDPHGEIRSTTPACPFVDLSSGGSIHGIIAAADKVLAMSNAQTRIIPGHGPLADRARLKLYRDMVVALRDRVRTLISTGRRPTRSLSSTSARRTRRTFRVGMSGS